MNKCAKIGIIGLNFFEKIRPKLDIERKTSTIFIFFKCQNRDQMISLFIKEERILQ
jgi:hypothetical protein